MTKTPKNKTTRKHGRKAQNALTVEQQETAARSLLYAFTDDCRKQGIHPAVMTREVVNFASICVQVATGREHE